MTVSLPAEEKDQKPYRNAQSGKKQDQSQNPEELEWLTHYKRARYDCCGSAHVFPHAGEQSGWSGFWIRTDRNKSYRHFTVSSLYDSFQCVCVIVGHVEP